MSRRLAAPAKALLPRCLCDGGGVPALFRREACRYASSKSSKSPKLQPQPQSSKPAPQKNKTLPYKAQPAPLPPPKDSSSSSSTANNSKAQPISDLVRQRFMPIFGFGAAALCLGAVLASGAYHWAHDEVVRYPPGKEPQVPTGRASIQSPVEFDLHLDKSEWRLGITKLRRRLAEQAHGHVLEVAMGAGRNLEHYDWDRVTESLLASDAERNKLRLARAGWG
ncbi:methyltransferase OMS1 [Microdochium nivale]|nr:methyltransferase OMS1 [Microdochium nivale]